MNHGGVCVLSVQMWILVAVCATTLVVVRVRLRHEPWWCVCAFGSDEDSRGCVCVCDDSRGGASAAATWTFISDADVAPIRPSPTSPVVSTAGEYVTNHVCNREHVNKALRRSVALVVMVT